MKQRTHRRGWSPLGGLRWGPLLVLRRRGTKRPVRLIAWEWYDREDRDRLTSKLMMSSTYGKFGAPRSPDRDVVATHNSAASSVGLPAASPKMGADLTAAGVAMETYCALFCVEKSARR